MSARSHQSVSAAFIQKQAALLEKVPHLLGWPEKKRISCRQTFQLEPENVTIVTFLLVVYFIDTRVAHRSASVCTTPDLLLHLTLHTYTSRHLILYRTER
jgi:hypothetical protein